MKGHTKLVEMLLQRGARVNSTNMGDDIPLHLAASHGHLDIVLLVSLLSIAQHVDRIPMRLINHFDEISALET